MNFDDLFVTSSIPRPLSKKETKDLIMRIQQGDLDARNELITHNILLVLHVIKEKCYYWDYDKKDLLSVGIIGLIKATDTFNPIKNNEFTTYAIKCIRNEIYNFFRSLKKNNKVDSLDRPLQGEYNYDLTLENLLIDDNDFEEEIIEKYYIKECVIPKVKESLNILNEKERIVITLYFGFDDNKQHMQKEIARILGITRAYVSKILITALQKISRYLEREGVIDPKSTKITKSAQVYKR